jgi:hypothetical protein
MIVTWGDSYDCTICTVILKMSHRQKVPRCSTISLHDLEFYFFVYFGSADPLT